jgi:predicted ATPase/class 3 adenylate cyclase
MSRPTGVITFLLSDVEDSTRLWDADRAGMASSLELHDRIVREAVAGRGGHVFSTAGDAFAVAFSSPDGAVDAAVAIQLGLGSAEWPGPPISIRIGLHTGTTIERDGDYFGPAVNLAARIMSAGQGGRILLSSVTAGLLDSSQIELADRGSHRLAGIGRPETIVELLHPDLPRVDLPLRTADVATNNLPPPLSSFVGRTDELADLGARLEQHRLVVLTGAGGTGKTRLAIEGARRASTWFDDGVWLIELAPLSEPELVMSAIGDVFGLRPGERTAIEEVVTRHLARRRLLLVIDNCEHVLSGATRAIEHVLAKAPDVRVLATSRESLGISGESVLHVPSLGLPDGRRAEESDSVALFLDRARAVLPEFTPTPDELDSIAWICRRVDGMPLGIELAAARLRSMTPRELATRLETSFKVLAGSEKSSVPRQRTLEATIEWSHDLLTPSEQSLFRSLAVYAGGFDLRGAESLGAAADLDADDVLDVLDSLVDKSLVSPRRTDLGTRFRLLEPVRQYAERRLTEAGREEQVRRAHADHMARFVAEAGPGLRGFDQVEWRRRLDVDYDNVRAALRWLFGAGDFACYLDMVFDLFMYWVHSGQQVEGIELCVAGANAAGHAHDERAIKAWAVAAAMGAEITMPAAIEHARSGLDLARGLGDPNTIGRLEAFLGAAIRHSTTDEAYLGHLLEGRRLLDEHPEPRWWEPEWDSAFMNLIFGAYFPADEPRMGEHLEAALTTFERLGDKAMLAATLTETSGTYGADTGPRIIANLRRALELLDEVHVPYWEGHARMILGMLLELSGAPDEAAVHLDTAADQLADVGDISCWATASRGLALCEAATGSADRGAGPIVAVIAELPHLPMQEVAVPRTLDTAATVLTALERFEEAAFVLGCAQRTPFEVQTVLPRSARLDRVRAELAEALPAEAFDRAWNEGAETAPLECLARARSWLVDLAG